MLRLVSLAGQEPISVEQVKVRLRIDGGDFDDVLPAMITAAREIVERQTGYALASADYEWTPEGDTTSPLPIQPGDVTSDDGDVPIKFTTTPGPAPAALVAAMVLLVGEQLTNTEATMATTLQANPAVQDLIFPYRDVRP